MGKQPGSRRLITQVCLPESFTCLAVNLASLYINLSIDPGLLLPSGWLVNKTSDNAPSLLYFELINKIWSMENSYDRPLLLVEQVHLYCEVWNSWLFVVNKRLACTCICFETVFFQCSLRLLINLCMYVIIKSLN